MTHSASSPMGAAATLLSSLKFRELLARHHTRPIAARVTMTSQAMDVFKIYRHLKHDLGFHEVGFAPVTSSANRLYSIGVPGMNDVFLSVRRTRQNIFPSHFAANCTAFQRQRYASGAASGCEQVASPVELASAS